MFRLQDEIHQLILHGNGADQLHALHDAADLFVRNGGLYHGLLVRVRRDGNGGPELAADLHEHVKKSGLHDEKLDMFVVNDNIMEETKEIGRQNVFPRGWLENEAVFLHMEYKYLLELLRSGLYKEFFEDFKKAAVPFLDKEVYGRSTLENSSFIASSFNPNEQIHGKGFVARLSGSTIEFISMWKLMFFGRQLFSQKDGKLVFQPQPAIPEYLIREDDQRGRFFVAATMLGKTKVTYEFDKKADFFPGEYSITGMKLVYADGRTEEVSGGCVAGSASEDLRNGLVSELTVKITS